MEATTEQRHRLLESIFRRNHQRRSSSLEPLNLTMAYAHGLNRILRANLLSHKQQADRTVSMDIDVLPDGQIIMMQRPVITPDPPRTA